MYSTPFDNYTTPTPPTNFSESLLVSTTRTVCQIWISFPIAVCGIIGNFLSIIVFNRYKQARPTTMLLKAIAVTETLILILILILRSFREFELPFSILFVSHMFPILYPLTYFFKMVNIWLTVLLTVERCIAVCKPFKAQVICTSKKTRNAIIVIILIVALFTTPRFYEYHHVPFEENPAGFEETALMRNFHYSMIYRIFLFLLIGYIIPILLLLFLNIKISATLRWTNKQHTSLFLFNNRMCHKTKTPHGSLYDMTRSLTTIAVTVVSVFIICNATVIVSQILYSIEVSFKILKDRIELPRRIMSNISNVFATISCAINFFIYCFFSKKFRIILFNFLCCRKRKTGQNGVSDFYMSTKKTMISIKKVGSSPETWKDENSNHEDFVVYKHRDTLNIVFNR